MSLSNIDVVIVTRNRPHQLVNCVRQVSLNSVKPARVIIIDSSDEVHNIAKNKIIAICEKKKIKIIYLNIDQKGLSYSRNVGIKNVRSIFFAFIDDDEYIPKNWLKEVKSFFEVNRNIDVVHGPMVPNDLKNYWNRVWECVVKDNFATEGETDFLNVGNSAYRTKFVKVNNLKFDNSFVFASEDRVFLYILKKAGAKVYFSKKLSLMHDYRKTMTQFIRQWFNYGRGMYTYNNNYPGSEGTVSLKKDFPFKIKTGLSLLPGIMLLNASFLLGYIFEALTASN